jgi:hypothetical protein
MRMASSGMLRVVALIRTDVSEEYADYIFKLKTKPRAESSYRERVGWDNILEIRDLCVSPQSPYCSILKTGCLFPETSVDLCQISYLCTVSEMKVAST